MRSVFERRKELAVMRALGYRNKRLASIVLFETALLLLVGLFIGVVAAMFTTVPFLVLGHASLPWRELFVLCLVIIPIGLVASWLASRNIRKMPLLQSLRV